MMDTKTIQELQELEDRLENDLLGRLSKHKIEELQRVIATHFVKRFIGKRRKAKYGNISKCFKDSEITAFFKVVNDEKFRLLFLYQSTLGLRIGEAVKLNIKDLNLESRELLINTEKEGIGAVDSLIVPMDLFNETLEFIKDNQKEIEKAQGYIFYANDYKTARKGLYLEKNGVRNKFREYCSKAGLLDVYSAQP
ncbi:tyrosine-type recombinase/integrase [Candidatus Marsarchaeota archaeon]|nr:tyrosine-type recombinase/integrase [Candidatus Marsarchaeota archaeon]